jgi:hypothetical protein
LAKQFVLERVESARAGRSDWRSSRLLVGNLLAARATALGFGLGLGLVGFGLGLGSLGGFFGVGLGGLDDFKPIAVGDAIFLVERGVDLDPGLGFLDLLGKLSACASQSEYLGEDSVSKDLGVDHESLDIEIELRRHDLGPRNPRVNTHADRQARPGVGGHVFAREASGLDWFIAVAIRGVGRQSVATEASDGVAGDGHETHARVDRGQIDKGLIDDGLSHLGSDTKNISRFRHWFRHENFTKSSPKNKESSNQQ